MGIELVQWGEAGKPEHKHVMDPGAATLLLRVTNADALVARAGKAGYGVMRRNLGPPTLHDPDGFPVELEQSDNPGADLTVSVSDIGKATELYGRLLGLKEDRIRFKKVKAGDAPVASFPAAGQGMLRVFVRDIDALTASLKGAGFSAITTGGEPVTLPQGQRVIIVRDPNNFYIQPMEAK
jgi:hypothetical protein